MQPSLFAVLSVGCLLSAVAGLKGPAVAKGSLCCLGEALFDCIATESSDPDRPAADLQASGEFERHAGGAPANVAVSARKLGLASSFVGALGSDAAGDELLAAFAANDVDASSVARTEAPTREVMVNVDGRGDRHFAGFLDGRAPGDFADAALAVLPEAGRRTVLAADVLVTGTLGLAFPAMRRVMEDALQLRRDAGKVNFVDVNWRDVFWLPKHDEESARRSILGYLRGADFIKLTDEEAAFLFPGTPAEAFLREPALLLDDGRLPHTSAIFVTAGENGCAAAMRRPLSLEAQQQVLPKAVFAAAGALAVDAVDTTGAGDAFTAGIIACMAAGRVETEAGLRDALAFASAVGGFTCTRAGAWESPSVAEALALHEAC